eukprot:CFRG1415T1
MNEKEIALTTSTTASSCTTGTKRNAPDNDRKDLDGMFQSGNVGTKRKRIFMKEVKHMMFGFGDVKKPLRASCELMEEIVFDFVQNVLAEAQEISKTGKVRTEDLCLVIHNDPKKLGRVQELLVMADEIKKARKIDYDVDDLKNAEKIDDDDAL